MTDAIGARLIGGLRAVSGAIFLARSHSVARRWVDDDRDETAVLTRSVGVRDLAIGTALALTGRREMLLTSLAADLSDSIDALLGSVPESRRCEVAAWAAGFAALTIAAAALDSRRSRSPIR